VTRGAVQIGFRRDAREHAWRLKAFITKHCVEVTARRAYLKAAARSVWAHDRLNGRAVPGGQPFVAIDGPGSERKVALTQLASQLNAAAPQPAIRPRCVSFPGCQRSGKRAALTLGHIQRLAGCD
jgi:hypothetical protein